MSLPDSATYVGLFLLIVVGESGVPLLVPAAEVALVAAGFGSAFDPVRLAGFVAVAIAADVIGGMILYSVVRAAAAGRRVPRVWRRAVEVGRRGSERLGTQRSGRVIIGRAVPLVRVPTAAAAALAGMSAGRFAVCVLAGSLIWVGLFMGGGAVAAHVRGW